MYTNPGLIGPLATYRQVELMRAARARPQRHGGRRRAALRRERESARPTPLHQLSAAARAGRELLESA